MYAFKMKPIMGGLTKVEYNVIHNYLRYHHGNATKCEVCGRSRAEGRRIEWAKREGREYTRNIEDYWQLCVSCHRKYDYGEYCVNGHPFSGDNLHMNRTRRICKECSRQYKARSRLRLKNKNTD